MVPGLALAGAATVVAFGVEALVPGLNATTVAVLLGALAVNVDLITGRHRAGVAFCGRTVLRIAVVLLGLQLSLSDVRDLGAPGLAVVVMTVAVTFLGTRVLGRVLGVRGALALLVATGFSICGASAVAGMQPVADGDEDDTVVAVALVTLCGSLAIVILPLLRVPLGLDYTQFGSWVGASVHDVGQTVATANRVGHATLEPAVVVKLSRVLLLAPLVAGVGLARRSRPHRPPPAGAQPGAAGHRPARLPLFVAGFVGAVMLRSTGWLPGLALEAAHGTQQVLLTTALFGLGTGVSWRLLRRAGGRPLLLGLLSWLLVAGIAYAGVRLTG